ncbi:MAG: isocitrate lyase/PEP mutase family protein [Kofleriaceae bacterium]
MAEKLRSLLEAPGAIELPGCYDTMSAMIIEEVGFACVFLSGYGVAASLMGNPDIGLTTMSETTMMARYVTSRVGIPVIVDADNGYGNEDNVVRTVRELESGGAAAMVMEDQVLPKRCGHTNKKKILPLEIYMRKLDFAMRARQTPMCIVARTDSMDLDDAIKRAKAFHSAGADILLIDGLRSLDQMKRVCDEVPGNKQVNLIWGGVTPSMQVAQFHQMGFKVVQYSTPALYVASRMLRATMGRLRETKQLDAIADYSDSFHEFQRFIEDRYIQQARNEHIYPDDESIAWADSVLVPRNPAEGL